MTCECFRLGYRLSLFIFIFIFYPILFLFIITISILSISIPLYCIITHDLSLKFPPLTSHVAVYKWAFPSYCSVFVTDEDLRSRNVLLFGSIATCKLNISLVLCGPSWQPQNSLNRLLYLHLQGIQVASFSTT